MSRKITQEMFLQQFKVLYPEEDITILDYTAISKPATIRCNKCGKEQTKSIARNFINSFHCCSKSTERKVDKIKKLLDAIEDYDFIKQKDKDHIILRHNICKGEFVRAIPSVMNNIRSCPYCDTRKTLNKLSLEEAQNQLQQQGLEVQILEYNGQLEKNKYRCKKCGLIFEQQHTCLLQSRGCPKCDRYQSKGEKFMRDYLIEHHIIFDEQVAVPELPLQHFDFMLYTDETKNDIRGIIEVNGEQHYKQNNRWTTPLRIIQERDQRKKDWCKQRNIPFYEIKWFHLKFKNLDILPF